MGNEIVHPAMDLTRIDANTPITIDSANPVVLSVATVCDWVAPGAPKADALKFLLACRAARLNPLLNEAYLVPMGDGVTKERKWSTVIAKSGYLKRAQESPDYDGHECGLVIQIANQILDIEGTIRPSVEGCAVLGGWAKVWKKGVSRPTYRRASFAEYEKPTHIWRTLPNTMIAKCALAAAIRDAFAIGDSYDEAESPVDLPETPPSVPAVVVTTPAPPALTPEVVTEAAEVVIDVASRPVPPNHYRTSDAIGYVRPDLISDINDLAARLGLSAEEYTHMLAKRNVSSAADLTVTQAKEIVSRLRGLDSEAQADAVFGPKEEKAEGITLPEVQRKESA